MTSSQHVYEVRPRKGYRGVDLISDALPFGRLWYGEPDPSGTPLETRSFQSAHMTPSFAFTMKRSRLLRGHEPARRY
jgi:hypothetical protein